MTSVGGQLAAIPIVLFLVLGVAAAAQQRSTQDQFEPRNGGHEDPRFPD